MTRILLTIISAVSVLSGGMAQEITPVSAIPPEVSRNNFAALMANSPFSRSLNLSDSLILTGVATVDEEQLATVMDRNTKMTYVVSSKPNAQGWKLSGLDASTDLETVTATISVDGSSTVKVRYDEMKLKNGEGKPAGGPGVEPAPQRTEGDGGRGRGGPGSDMREKMMALSEEDRGKVFQKMMELREKNPDMSREERGEIMSKMMEKMGSKDRKR